MEKVHLILSLLLDDLSHYIRSINIFIELLEYDKDSYTINFIEKVLRMGRISNQVHTKTIHRGIEVLKSKQLIYSNLSFHSNR